MIAVIVFERPDGRIEYRTPDQMLPSGSIVCAVARIVDRTDEDSPPNFHVFDPHVAHVVWFVRTPRVEGEVHRALLGELGISETYRAWRRSCTRGSVPEGVIPRLSWNEARHVAMEVLLADDAAIDAKMARGRAWYERVRRWPPSMAS